MTPDEVLEELVCWVDLSNRVTLSTEVSVLRLTIEPQARTDIVLSMAEERRLLVQDFATGVLTITAAIAAESVPLRQSQHALREEIANLPSRIEALEKGYVAEMQARLDIRAGEMSQLDETRARLSEEIQELTQRRDEELASIAAFRGDLDERRSRLQAFKVSSAQEMQELELQLETLRNRVAGEKVVLEQLLEEEAVKRKKIELLNEMGIKPSHFQPQPSNSATAVPSRLDAGIQALQSVREHLREIRSGNSQSPNRSGSSGPTTRAVSGGMTVSSSSPVPPSPAGTGGQSVMLNGPSSSPILVTPITPRGTGIGTTPHGVTNTSTPLNSSTFYASPSVNPWKERLRQLQGDLQTLRADLGAK
eukprot:CAMPEP_0176410708 /NCGR_PEP_ID=MMETSP0127-20121128/3204_1 /TAXON_ID=938130 /ORGANISM="Platyophrya macrostoma, Strain WH" /LENGTH=363 /DNA_ID=CAMNT_0017790229 /DNA_START=171 /DNA_END=1262 /DNA_ORIENTATION=+